MVLWNRDGSWGRVHSAPAGFTMPMPVDENRSGTVLLSAYGLGDQAAPVFVYSGGHEGAGVYRALPTPEGFRSVWPEAINNRGDALGHVFPADGADDSAVLWPADGSPPVVIDLPPDNELVQVVDLDDDGTALLHLAQGPHLWRNGHLTKLAHPAGYWTPWANSIRDGRVVGHARTDDGQATYQGFLWSTPDQPQPIKNNAVGEDINKYGLVIGRATIESTGAVWLGTIPLGDLPNNGTANRVSDDNSILGTQYDGSYAVWRWRCTTTRRSG